MLPPGYDKPGFDLYAASDPSDRITNAGFMVVTIEFDWESAEDFDRNIGWFSGKGGKFQLSQFAEANRQLSRYREYRGFSAVYSGRRSIHIHFLFDTKHLVNAPFSAEFEVRIENSRQYAAVMATAHHIAWERVKHCVMETLKPGLEPDDSLACYPQWRRAPFGENTLERDCGFLGLKRGEQVPQIVLCEQVRTDRAAKGSTVWLIEPHLWAEAQKRAKSSGGKKARHEEVSGEVLQLLRGACENEWGAPFPQPMHVGWDGADAIIHFANDESDQNPSSIVKGEYRKLLLCGKGATARDFYLPGGHSANGLVAWAVEAAAERRRAVDARKPIPPEERAEIIARDRRFLSVITDISLPRNGRDHLITSVEGAGKTTSLLHNMRGEMLDVGMWSESPNKHFMCYAARSKQQAIEKRNEYAATAKDYQERVVLESFRSVYKCMCDEAEVEPLEFDDFESNDISEKLATIRSHQPEVYDLLDEYRRKFWKDASYNHLVTMIFTTKATIRTWHSSRATRAWLHPKFVEGMSSDEVGMLAADFGLGLVAFDELEQDEFLRIWSEPYYHLISSHQKEYENWGKLAYREKCSIYLNARRRHPHEMDRVEFEQFDADMRVPLSSLEQILVDYDDYPFGHDREGKGIYRPMHGYPFFLGLPEWLHSGFGCRSYLTTEQLMTEVVRAVYRKLSKGRKDRTSRLWHSQIDPPKELFPVLVDLFMDQRAGKRQITELAREITDANSNAWVICNNVDGNDRVLTFQSAKGANHLADKDIYVIVTHLAPEHYAQLNVVGQWLGIPDVIDLYYRDQISQAVGRNRGMRGDEKNLKTVVIASSRLMTSGFFCSPVTEHGPAEEQEDDSPLAQLRESSHRWRNAFVGGEPRRERPAHIRFNLVENRPW